MERVMQQKNKFVRLVQIDISLSKALGNIIRYR